MLRSFLAGSLMLLLAAALAAQERRSRIDVEHYVITGKSSQARSLLLLPRNSGSRRSTTASRPPCSS